MGRLHVKFHEDRCKGEAVMRLKPFYLTAQFLHCDLDLWPFDPKVHRAHTWLMGRLHVKFHEDRCKGEAFIRLKPFYLTARLQADGRTDGQTDRQTDGRTDRRTGWFQYTPPLTSLGGGGYNKFNFIVLFMYLVYIKSALTYQCERKFVTCSVHHTPALFQDQLISQ